MLLFSIKFLLVLIRNWLGLGLWLGEAFWHFLRWICGFCGLRPTFPSFFPPFRADLGELSPFRSSINLLFLAIIPFTFVAL